MLQSGRRKGPLKDGEWRRKIAGDSSTSFGLRVLLSLLVVPLSNHQSEPSQKSFGNQQVFCFLIIVEHSAPFRRRQSRILFLLHRNGKACGELNGMASIRS